MTDVELVTGPGTVGRLGELVGWFAPRRVLVVATPAAVGRFDLADLLHGYEVRYFGGFTPNPQLDDALSGARLAEGWDPEIVVGVGGGSTLDTAKLVRSLPVYRDRALAVLAGQIPPERRAPLVLVPTTSSICSEVTSFATVYVDRDKRSLDHPTVRAELSLVDPDLLTGCPPGVALSAALDVVAHAVESTWAVRSTCESRALAADALAALVPALRKGEWPWSAGRREEVSTAATRAGLAVDRTRTTAGHAFAHPLTVRLGIPHGLACALNLVWLLPLSARLLYGECQDPRGPAFVARRLDELAVLLGGEPGPAVADLITACGFSPWLTDHGVRAEEVPGLVYSALRAGRAANGPVRLTADAVVPWLGAHIC